MNIQREKSGEVGHWIESVKCLENMGWFYIRSPAASANVHRAGGGGHNDKPVALSMLVMNHWGRETHGRKGALKRYGGEHPPKMSRREG